MLSLTECKKILNRNGICYSDKEVELIKKFIYNVAEVKYGQIKKY